MLSLELCKALKDVGFPQDLKNGDWGYCLDCEDGGELHLAHDDNDEGCFVGNDYNHHLDEDYEEGRHNFLVKCPTLSELIEACPIEKLQKVCDGLWEAFHETSLQEATGKTPEIAVANLYLALKSN